MEEIVCRIDGDAVTGGGAPLTVVDPATEEVLAEGPQADAADVDAAVVAARRAQRDWWRATGAAERAEMLHAVASRIREHAGEIARLMTLEGGKPLVENTDEMGWSAACFDYYAELGRNEEGRVLPPVEPHQFAVVLKEPLGVVACIVPWNYPLLLLAWKVAPALAAGNTVVAKPSEKTPLSTVAFARLCLADVLPGGVCNVVVGAGDAGHALVAHPDVTGVAFTGSTKVGQDIARLAADDMKRVHLELGGKDAFIVCPDVDVGVAAEGAAWAAFLNTGQVCTSAERFYVLDSVHDEFVEALADAARRVRVGPGLHPDTDMGPLIDAGARGRVEAQVATAVAAGARVVAGGDRTARDQGYFYAPTVLVDPDPACDLMVAETFGPVAPVTKVASVAEAVAAANSSRYGLGANVYTKDLDTILYCMRELQAGTVWFNDPLTDNDAGPFGGCGLSGRGRELGPEGLEEFRETKHVHIDPRVERKDWWYPY